VFVQGQDESTRIERIIAERQIKGGSMKVGRGSLTSLIGEIDHLLGEIETDGFDPMTFQRTALSSRSRSNIQNTLRPEIATHPCNPRAQRAD
jgi:hypothetical protein